VNKIKCFLIERIEPARYVDRFEGKIKSPLYRRMDTGEEISLYEAPPGAMWFYYRDISNGDPGVLFVMTPGGEWCVDSQASNCTRPGEDHKCWIRHGEAPDITVDKNGNTCAAGAGSIQCGSYHGFLRNGYLEEC
jgi:hypothetical protein